MDYEIRPLNEGDLESVKAFTDQWIGKDYYSLEELKNVLTWSKHGDLCASFVALDGEKLIGVRLTYAPGQWIPDGARGITPDLWKINEGTMAYFKSLFISGDYQKKGLGRILSTKSIEVLKKMGAEGILCHSWLESPGNSSQKYLIKMGFEDIKAHEKYWYHIDYHCTRCGPERCVCTAMEMAKYLE